jgi:hypothetical protein
MMPGNWSRRLATGPAVQGSRKVESHSFVSLLRWSNPRTKVGATKSVRTNTCRSRTRNWIASPWKAPTPLIIEKFVPRSEIDERYLDSPYYLTPENKVGQDAFGVIREAMKRKNMVGLGKVVISRRERIVKLKDYAFLRLTCPCGRITDYPSGLLLQRRGVSRESFLGNIEKFMRLAFIAEDREKVRVSLKQAVTAFRNPLAVHQLGLHPEFFPFIKIRDTVHFAKKDESRHLQVADICTFVMRGLSKKNPQ